MGINLRLLQIAALAVGTVLCVPANAQYERWQEHHDRDEGKSGAYQDGYRDGMRDGEAHRRGAGHNNRWKTGHERHDYDSGYNAGFQAGEARRGHEAARDHDRDRDSDRGHGFGGNPVGGPQHGGSQAARIGYEDGMMDGQKDRRTGHSFRPTQGDNYKSATRGYYSSMGSKDQYKQEYRRTYAEAYQRGYYGR